MSVEREIGAVEDEGRDDNAWIDAMWDGMCGAAKALAEAQMDILVRLLKARFPFGDVVHLVADPGAEAVRVSRVLTTAGRDLFDPRKEDLGRHAFLIAELLAALGPSPHQHLNPSDDWEHRGSWVYVFELPDALPDSFSVEPATTREHLGLARMRRSLWRVVWCMAVKQLMR